MLIERFQSNVDLKEVGNYIIEKEIGSGSFGKIYIGNHKMLNIPVCLKRGPKSSDNDNLMREFYYLKEFRDHPNIIKLYEIVFMESCIYLIMDYYPRGDLFDFVTNNGKLNLNLSLKIFTQLAGAVFYIHSNGCCHRDLKLENVLLDDDGNVKLGDFGFTRELPLKSLLRDICGTNAYMAPELIKRLPYSGIKIDIWALGIILYTLITGEMPFDDSLDEFELNHLILHSTPRFMNSLDPDVYQLVNILLQKEPEDRPNNLEYILKLPILDRFGGKESVSIVTKLKYNETSITRGEKAMFKDLIKIGFNKANLKEAIKSPQMDSTYAIWELLRENRSKKKRQKRRPLLRINTRSESTEDGGMKLRRAASIKNVKNLLTGTSESTEDGGMKLKRASSIKNVKNLLTGSSVSTTNAPITSSFQNNNNNTTKKFSFRGIFQKKPSSGSINNGLKRVLSGTSGVSGVSGISGVSASIMHDESICDPEDDDDDDVNDDDDDDDDVDDEEEEDVEEINTGINSLSVQNKRLRPGSVISGISIQTTLSETSNGSGYVTGYSTDVGSSRPKYNNVGSNGNLSPVLCGSPNSLGASYSGGGLSRQSSVDSMRDRKMRKLKDIPMSSIGEGNNTTSQLLKRGKSPLSARMNTTWKFNTPKHVKMKQLETNIIEEDEECREGDEEEEEEEEEDTNIEPKLHRKRFRRAPTLATALETDEEGDDEEDEDEDMPYSPTPQRGNVVKKLESIVRSSS